MGCAVPVFSSLHECDGWQWGGEGVLLLCEVDVRVSRRIGRSLELFRAVGVGHKGRFEMVSVKPFCNGGRSLQR